jgi:hypothetical protein
LGFRFAFFGGIGGTYATAGYAPLRGFLSLTFQKLTHLDALFVGQSAFITQGRGALLDQATMLGTRLLTYTLFSLLALSIMLETANRLRDAMCERRWPTAEPAFLVSLWAAIALGFHFALALSRARYATSVVVFAWPALVAEIERRRQAVIWLGLAVFCVVSTLRSYRSVEFVWFPKQRELSPMTVALDQVPINMRQVYILPASDDHLPMANPEYVRLILGVPAEMVRIIDIDWNCSESNNLVTFDHSIADGIIKLTVTLPACANFVFYARIGDEALANGHLCRNATMSYELPDTIRYKLGGVVDVGRRMTVFVRPNGPARFIIQHGGPSGIAWFDTP